MLLFFAKSFVAWWITLMSSVGVWLPIFFVRREREERITTSLAAGTRSRRLHTMAAFTSTKRWLSLADCLSAGMLLTMALVHFFPESFVVDASASPNVVVLCRWMLVGILIPAVLERSVKGGGAHVDEEHERASGRASAISTSKLLIILMCYHGLMEGLLLGFENEVAALLSAAVPLSGHKFCDGLVIGVSVAKEMCSEIGEEPFSGEAVDESCIKSNRASNRFWRQLFQGPVGVWLLLLPITMTCVFFCTSFLSSGTAPVDSAGLHGLPPAAPSVSSTVAKASSVSILAALQAIGSGSFVYMGLTILSKEDLKGIAPNVALVAGVGLTGVLFHLTSEYH
ncbi:hypothetical protein LSCM1_02485 [Leishmania martiniquensis]|uniref:ZIP Zinc transporter n=1 Tax=Leishmania martiniquensis TaxID=1580590 RepID=A0A836H2N9_9TRYP|nr:hypothetical protein LSCM1_02485 [Leishmania martiniquensis]